MEIRFREVDPFNCWIWMRFSHPLGHGERGYVETVFDSWFFLGKLGGFNAETLQLHEEAADLSWLVVDEEEAQQALPALMHNMGPLELQGEWARCWVDMGTSDVFALDVDPLELPDRRGVEHVRDPHSRLGAHLRTPQSLELRADGVVGDMTVTTKFVRERAHVT